jgi:DnaJ-class molecular chaperone
MMEVKIRDSCTECKGFGVWAKNQAFVCPACHGDGEVTRYISLAELARLLEMHKHGLDADNGGE